MAVVFLGFDLFEGEGGNREEQFNQSSLEATIVSSLCPIWSLPFLLSFSLSLHPPLPSSPPPSSSSLFTLPTPPPSCASSSNYLPSLSLFPSLLPTFPSPAQTT